MKRRLLIPICLLLAAGLTIPCFALLSEGTTTTPAPLPPPVFVAPGEEHLMHIKTTEEGIRYSVKEDETVCIEGYISTALTLTVPNEIDGMPVNEIARAAFFGNTGLISIILPDSLTLIGEDAFASCPNLTAVTLPDSVKVIPAGCFADCKALRTLNLPVGLEEIGFRAFRGCAILSKLTAPPSLSKIGLEAFYGCEQLIFDCKASPYAAAYASENRIPQSFFETSNAQWLALALTTAALAAAFFLLRTPVKRWVRKLRGEGR